MSISGYIKDIDLGMKALLSSASKSQRENYNVGIGAVLRIPKEVNRLKKVKNPATFLKAIGIRGFQVGKENGVVKSRLILRKNSIAHKFIKNNTRLNSDAFGTSKFKQSYNLNSYGFYFSTEKNKKTLKRNLMNKIRKEFLSQLDKLFVNELSNLSGVHPSHLVNAFTKKRSSIVYIGKIMLNNQFIKLSPQQRELIGFVKVFERRL